MRESEVMGNYHASFGERDGETRPMRVGKVRAVPTLPSPVMANLALDGLEKLLKAHYPPNTKRAQRAKVNLVRYCDDFIITGSAYALLEHEVKPLVAQFLGERGLELSPTKTHRTSIEDGFDFLGQHLRK